jgi:hypothetical protein
MTLQWHSRPFFRHALSALPQKRTRSVSFSWCHLFSPPPRGSGLGGCGYTRRDNGRIRLGILWWTGAMSPPFHPATREGISAVSGCRLPAPATLWKPRAAYLSSSLSLELSVNRIISQSPQGVNSRFRDRIRDNSASGSLPGIRMCWPSCRALFDLSRRFEGQIRCKEARTFGLLIIGHPQRVGAGAGTTICVDTDVVSPSSKGAIRGDCFRTTVPL